MLMTNHIVFISKSALPHSLQQDLSDREYQVSLIHQPTQIPKLALENPPQVVVLDVGHNRQEMIDLCYRIKRATVGMICPLLVVTASSGVAREAALSAGADDVLNAPLESQELLHRLKLWLVWRQKQSEIELRAMGDIDILAHDLKSPLGTIVPTLDFLQYSLTEDDTLRKLANDALQASHRETLLLDNLLDYLRLQYQPANVRLSWEVIDINNYVRMFDAQIKHVYERRNLPVEYELEAEEVLVRTDGHWLNRVLSALFDNSVKFCTQRDKVRIRTFSGYESITIQIADTGRKIIDTHETAIFDPANQFNARLDGSRTSVALNLPFAKEYIDLIGGTMRLDADDEWVRFNITFSVYNEDD